MGTISSSLPSSSASSSSSNGGTSSANTNTTGIFTGTSAYSQDFQNVINREVAIASLPIQILTNQQTTLSDQSKELDTLDGKFAALQTAVKGIQTALNGSSFQATISNPAVASASLSDGAVEGAYSMLVISPGAYATSLSSRSWVGSATGKAHQYQLSVGTNTYTFTPTDNSAASVAAAIDAKYADKVQATVVNVGSSASPDYRISLQASQLGNAAVGLTDVTAGGANLQTAQITGQLATYQVNGSGLTVTSSSRSVTIATGVTINLLSSSTTAVDITVSRPTSALSDALSSFTDAYNAAVKEVNGQRGQSGGALQGQSLLSHIAQMLGDMGTFNTASGPITGLASLGLDLGTNGQIEYNAFTLMAADLGSSQNVTSFLGLTTGGGFLKAATDALAGLEDPVSGLIKTSESAITSQIADLGKTIAAKQNQVYQLQASLISQMAAADSLIASMEQQYSYLSSMFAAQQTANQQYANG